MSRAPTHSTKEPPIRRRGRPRKLVEPSDTGDSLEDLRQDAITVAKMAYQAYQEAELTESPTKFARLRDCTKAHLAMVSAVRFYHAESQKRAVLVNAQIIIGHVRRCMEAIMRKLKTFAAEAGPQCNPAEPVRATYILQCAADEIIEAAQSALRDLFPEALPGRSSFDPLEHC